MNKYLKFTIILLFFSILILNTVNASDMNISDTLQSGDDNLLEISSSDGDILSDSPKSFTDLQTIIDSAIEGSVIDLDSDYKHVSGESTNLITITKTLTINGNGHIIDANNLGYDCYITADNVVLNIVFYQKFVPFFGK